MCCKRLNLDENLFEVTVINDRVYVEYMKDDSERYSNIPVLNLPKKLVRNKQKVYRQK